MKVSYFKSELVGCIDISELKAILLNLNIAPTQHVLDDYRELHLQELGADSSRNGEQMNWEQFRELYLLILRNQSTYFREVYNGREFHEIDL